MATHNIKALSMAVRKLNIFDQHQLRRRARQNNRDMKGKVLLPKSLLSRSKFSGLESIGKMLCRGTYTQVANPAWCCSKVREHIIRLFLKESVRECLAMCSKKNPSILRKTSKEDIVNFSLTKLENELKERTPLLRSVLMAEISTRAAWKEATYTGCQLYVWPRPFVSSGLSPLKL